MLSAQHIPKQTEQNSLGPITEQSAICRMQMRRTTPFFRGFGGHKKRAVFFWVFYYCCQSTIPENNLPKISSAALICLYTAVSCSNRGTYNIIQPQVSRSAQNAYCPQRATGKSFTAETALCLIGHFEYTFQGKSKAFLKRVGTSTKKVTSHVKESFKSHQNKSPISSRQVGVKSRVSCLVEAHLKSQPRSNLKSHESNSQVKFCQIKSCQNRLLQDLSK